VLVAAIDDVTAASHIFQFQLSLMSSLIISDCSKIQDSLTSWYQPTQDVLETVVLGLLTTFRCYDAIGWAAGWISRLSSSRL